MNTFEHYKNKARSLLLKGDYADAKDAFLEAYKTNDNDADILLGLGIISISEGKLNDAESYIYKAIKINPDNPGCYMQLGNLYRHKQEFIAAIDNYQIAISIQPDMSSAHLFLAGLLMGNKQLEDAEFHYSYALRLQPDNADAYANLAQVYEMLNKIEDARTSAMSALNLVDNHIGALITLGKIEKREGDYSKAANIFRSILNISSNDAIASIVQIELGHVLDKTGQYDDAFEAFTSGKQAWSRLSENLPFDKLEFHKRIKCNTKEFNRENIDKWHINNEVLSSNTDPIFFVGFPRSGTTLTEQILSQHPDIRTTSEQPFVYNVMSNIQGILNTDKPYPDCIHSATNEDIQLLKEAYWREVESEFDNSSRNCIVVDKLPLNIVNLGFISRVFPKAHVLVAIRDPRDSCLSCFMQSFTPNPAMVNFLSMKSTVDFYTEVMDIWLHYREVLPLNWFQYRYEDLVDDFDKVIRGIFNFLELDYPDNAADFYMTAQKRTITTPSYQDVTTPIYSRSKKRWKNYENYLQPYKEKLAPFIKEFGYSIDE